MDELLEALERSTSSENWYGALFVALSLPDICGKIDYPKDGSKKRYAAWFEKYILPRYTYRLGLEQGERVFLTGNDCYALRCAFLHEGSDDTSRQRAREAVDKFHFIVAPKGLTIHCNMINTGLKLQVDIFCKDIADGVRKWVEEIVSDKQKVQSIQTLLRIQMPDPSGGVRI
jgi:hypothetical protein